MKYSLKKTKDFDNVYKNKISFSTKNLIMYVLKRGDMECDRLGISVSHKVGNSVIRHKLIRRMRDIFEKNMMNLLPGYDIVVVYRIHSNQENYINLNEDFKYLCKKQQIFIDES